MTSPLTPSGAEALRRGDAAGARALFEREVTEPGADGPAWAGLLQACRALGDRAGERAALDGLLAVEPVNVRALILKGDLLAEAGEDRAAASFYSSALRRAPPTAETPPDLREGLGRAQARLRGYAAAYEAWLRERLAAFAGAEEGRRFEQALDLLLGRTQIYRQEPQVFYFPELPQIQFYPSFEWMAALEAETPAIRAEAAAVLADAEAFTPYVEAEANRPRVDQFGLMQRAEWSAFHLWKEGAPVAAALARCPATAAAVERLPLCRMPGRTPTVLFSLLRAGAHIPPHTGYVNTRLICHLPLIVPPVCEFRVGNETRPWVEGSAFAFDDTIEHEAWNRSAADRVVLIFDVWRPELSAGERARVTAMFEAIDAYGGERTAWSV